MSPGRVRLLTLLLIMLVAALPIAPAAAAPGAAASPETEAAEPSEPPAIRIAEQNHTVGPNGTFYAYLDITGAPAGAELAVDLYDAVTDLGDLDDALDGRPNRARVTYDVIPLSDRALTSQTAAFSIRLFDGTGSSPDPGAWSSRMDEPGVHPLRIRLRGPDGTELNHIVTFLHRGADRPEKTLDTVPILDLADGLGDPTREDSIQRLVEAFLVRPDIPVGLHLGPDTIGMLRADPELGPAIADLAARDRVEVLAETFVPVDPQQLVEEGFSEDIHDQIDLGRRVLDAEVGRAGSSTTILRSPVEDETATILRSAGIKRAIVTDAVIDSPPTGGPVRLGAATDVPVAIGSSLIDPPIGPISDPSLTAIHLLTDAIVRTELDGRHGTTAIVIDARTDAGLVGELLDRLADPDGRTRIRLPAEAFGPGPFPAAALRPTRARPSDAYTRARLDVEALQRSRQQMLPDDTPVDLEFERAMARTVSIELDEAERLGHLERIRQEITATFDEITTPETERITLGTRDAHIPISFTSSAAEPHRVLIRLDASERLEFPQDTIEAELGPEQRTIVEIPVKSLTTGDTPMTVTVTTPDGRIVIASARYTIRSTAVSGVGIVLTLGAAGFLVVWWSRHILRSRRDRRGEPGRATKM